MNILVIDDDVKILLMLDPYLKTKGYNVVSCTSFEDAIEFIKHEQPLLIISDMEVGETMNGLEFFIFHVFKTGFNFALFSGVLVPTSNAIKSLQHRIGEDYIISWDDRSQNDDQKIFNIKIQHTESGKIKTFPFFQKPMLPDKILNFFNL